MTSGWRHPDQLGAIGGFSGLFRLPGDGSRALVGSTDGVGTKILIAAAMRRYDTVGADLVNHCVNDILVDRAARCSFSTTSRSASSIRRSRRRSSPACSARAARTLRAARRRDRRDAGPVPAGRFRSRGHDRRHRRHRRRPRSEPACTPGDAIVGLPSIGLHTNGYTLARALIARGRIRRAVRRRRRTAMRCSRRIRRTTRPCARSGGRRREGDGAHHGRRLARKRAAHVARRTRRRCSSKRAGTFRRSWPNSCGAASSRHEERYRTLNMGDRLHADRADRATSQARSKRRAGRARGRLREPRRERRAARRRASRARA